jgi:uncharacterized protein YcbX
MFVGRIRSLHRYPVKSMCGEDLDASALIDGGLLGDRMFALRDEVADEIRGGKKWPRLMLCAARYRQEPSRESLPSVLIAFPDGSTTGTDDPDVSSRLSEWLGRRVKLCERAPASDKRHYRRALPGASVAGFLARADSMRGVVARLATIGPAGRDLRADFGREPGEPLPDLSVFPAEIFEYVSPLGTYYDAFPLHFVTTATLAALRALYPEGEWNARRFRPNFVVESPPSLEGLIESGWAGRTLRIGHVRFECTVPTPRCSMVAQAQPDLRKDPKILRTIVRDADQNVGMYARAVGDGRITVGDSVEIDVV